MYGYMLIALIDDIVKFSLLIIIYDLFLQIRILKNGDLWVVNFRLVQSLPDPHLTDFGKGSSKFYSGNYQPGCKLNFIIHCLVVLDD